MRFKMEIECDNDAFGETEEDRRAAVARLIREAALILEHGHDGTELRDINGNRVGRYLFAQS